MDISIIICTHNNAARLSMTLEAIRCCAFPKAELEVLVVANACTDDTYGVVDRQSGNLAVRLVSEPVKGLARARNKGCRSAQGELIIWADDDVTPVCQWIVAYWDAYRETHRCYFGGPVVSEYAGEPPAPELLPYCPASVAGFNLGADVRCGKIEFLAANWACPRTAIDRVGCFNEELGLGTASSGPRVGEETDLMYRLQRAGYEGRYLPEAGVRHYVPPAKTRLSYLGRRSAEVAHYHGLEGGILAEGGGRTICGIPGWLVRGWLLGLARYHRSLVVHKRDYESYFDSCRCRGLIKAYHNKLGRRRCQE